MYGENVTALRTELAALLRLYRIQQRIGGGGNRNVPVTTTEQDRAEIGVLIQRYRHGILTWCRQAVTAAAYGSPVPPSQGRPPDTALRQHLARTLDSVTSGLPSLDDLTTPTAFTLVEHWHHAARAAALGEHDLTGETATGSLDSDQCRAVVSDAAAVVRALAVLDDRYKNIPGWEHLRRATSLRQAAEACAFPDLRTSVHAHGWRPAHRVIGGRTRTGIEGVLQAQHNLLVHLQDLPTVLNLRRITHSQREISTIAATRLAADHPDLAATWAHRAEIYTQLGQRLRNIDGRAGTGASAATEAANAVSRLRALRRDAPVSTRDLRRLNKLFTSTDHRIVANVRSGATERIYFARTKLPDLDIDDGRPVHQPREQFRPMPHSEQRDLVAPFGATQGSPTVPAARRFPNGPGEFRQVGGLDRSDDSFPGP